MSITAIIPTRQGDDLTEKCIAALNDARRKPNRIVVVSDGAASAALRVLCERQATRIELVEIVEGSGFSTAVNAGLAVCPGGDVLVINNDCRITPGGLYSMAQELSADPLAAAVSPLLDDAGKCGIRHDYVRRISRTALNGKPPEESVSYRQTPPQKRVHVPWTCVLIRGTALAEVGPLAAERYPAGLYADDDWNLRATQLGWHCLLDTNAFAYHSNESATFQRLGLDYKRELADGKSQWLKRTNVLACVLDCDRKNYSGAGLDTANRLRWVSRVHVNYEGSELEHDTAVELESLTEWTMGSSELPPTPAHDQDQFYRLPRIVAARNMCLDLMRCNREYTHLLFVDSDVAAIGNDGLERLLLTQRPLVGGLIHGRGEQGHAEVVAGPREPYHGDQYTARWGSCGFQLIARPLCERYQFRWGWSKLSRDMRSEDPAFAEDVAADNWGRYVVDPAVRAHHVDSPTEPLTASTVAQF